MKKSTMKKIFVSFGAGTFGMLNAHAIPTIYPKNVTNLSLVQNTTKNYIVSDNIDPFLFYVLPSTNGRISKKIFHSKTINLGFCQEIADISEFSKDLNAQSHLLTKKLNTALIDLEQSKEKLAKEYEILTNLKKDSRYVEYENIAIMVTDLKQEIKDKNRELNKCQEKCEHLDRQIDQLMDRLDELNDRENDLRSNAYSQLAKIKAQTEHINQSEKIEFGLIDKVKIIENYLSEVKEKILRNYDKFTKMPAGVVSLTYTTDLSLAIEKLRRENPAFTFQPMPVENYRLHYALPSPVTSTLNSGIISYSVAGVPYNQPMALLPSLGDTFQTDIHINLLQGCALEHPKLFNLKNDVNDIGHGISAVYEFKTAYAVDVEMSYNLFKLYERVVEHRKKKRFFNSKDIVSERVNEIFNESLKIHWDDRHSQFSPEKKFAIEKQMRADLLNRLATHLGASSKVGPSDLTLPPLPQNGALVIADMVGQKCPHVYCQAGSMLLVGLDSILGNSTATTHYLRTLNVNIRDSYSQNGTTPFIWATSYGN
jgi:predicted  nucleic acid-binding Zn-ribbon protein